MTDLIKVILVYWISSVSVLEFFFNWGTVWIVLYYIESEELISVVLRKFLCIYKYVWDFSFTEILFWHLSSEQKKSCFYCL